MYGTTELIASLDLGTTSARAIIFNAEGRPLAASQKPLTQYFPHDGWVEQDAEEIWQKGTGCVEIKSGYGLTTEDELKILRVAQRVKAHSPLRIVTTFLGAHAVGRAYKGRQSEYVDLVINEMMPRVAAEGLADFVDVFCDEGFFTPEETDRILEAGEKYGMKGKIHADELAFALRRSADLAQIVPELAPYAPVTAPPAGVNFRALESRLSSTW